jgi:hypothetical protein
MDDSGLPRTLGIEFGVRRYELTDDHFLHPGELVDNLHDHSTSVARVGAFVVGIP